MQPPSRRNDAKCGRAHHLAHLVVRARDGDALGGRAGRGEVDAASRSVSADASAQKSDAWTAATHATTAAPPCCARRPRAGGGERRRRAAPRRRRGSARRRTAVGSSARGCQLGEHRGAACSVACAAAAVDNRQRRGKARERRVAAQRVEEGGGVGGARPAARAALLRPPTCGAASADVDAEHRASNTATRATCVAAHVTSALAATPPRGCRRRAAPTRRQRRCAAAATRRRAVRRRPWRRRARPKCASIFAASAATVRDGRAGARGFCARASAATARRVSAEAWAAEATSIASAERCAARVERGLGWHAVGAAEAEDVEVRESSLRWTTRSTARPTTVGGGGLGSRAPTTSTIARDGARVRTSRLRYCLRPPKHVAGSAGSWRPPPPKRRANETLASSQQPARAFASKRRAARARSWRRACLATGQNAQRGRRAAPHRPVLGGSRQHRCRAQYFTMDGRGDGTPAGACTGATALRRVRCCNSAGTAATRSALTRTFAAAPWTLHRTYGDVPQCGGQNASDTPAADGRTRAELQTRAACCEAPAAASTAS